ncbi:MAG: hypothetical protein ACMUIG_00235 [Thermoplasmatota archaeon]
MGKGNFMSVKGWISLVFGFGSILLFAELFVGVLIHEKNALSYLFSVPEWSIIGYMGLLLWLVAIVIGVCYRLSRSRTERSVKSIFLRGRESFKCPECGRINRAAGVGYHKRIECGCGKEYDVFQDMPWDETYEQADDA